MSSENNIILDILKNKYKNLENLRKCKVLEIGCGSGILAIQLCMFFKRYIAIDRDNNEIEKANINSHSLYKNLEFKIVNIENGISDLTKYNIIISKYCFHFIKDFGKFFNNINKILISGGIFIIIEPLPLPKGWRFNGYNENSKDFNIDKWNIKKKNLEKEHEYITTKLNCKFYEYETCRVYIIEK